MGAEIDAARVAQGAWAMVLAALTIRLMDEWWSYLPAGIVEDLRHDLGVSYAQAGSLIAIAVLSGLIGGPLGAIVDHADRKLVAITGAALQSFGLVLFAMGNTYPVLVVSVTILGGAGDLVIRPLEAALADQLSDEELERALGRQHVLTFIGDLAGPALLAIGAVTPLGWRGAFWVTAAALGAYTLFLVRVRFPPPAQAELDAPLPGIRDLVRRPAVLQLVLVEILLFPLDEPIAGLAVAAIAIRERGAAQAIAVGYVFGGLIGSGFVERRGLAPAVRSYGRALLLLGAAGVTVSVASAEWYGGPVFVAGALATAAMGVVGVGMGFTWAHIHHRQLTIAPGRTATVASIVGTLGVIGAAWPSAAGWVADRTSITGALMVIVGAGFVLAALRIQP